MTSTATSAEGSKFTMSTAGEPVKLLECENKIDDDLANIDTEKMLHISLNSDKSGTPTKPS
jgi:hypothetical protein